MYSTDKPPPSREAAEKRRAHLASMISDLRDRLTSKRWLDADGKPMRDEEYRALRAKVTAEYGRLVAELTYVRRYLGETHREKEHAAQRRGFVGELLDVIEDLRDAGAEITEAHADVLDRVAAWLDKNGWRPK